MKNLKFGLIIKRKGCNVYSEIRNKDGIIQSQGINGFKILSGLQSYNSLLILAKQRLKYKEV